MTIIRVSVVKIKRQFVYLQTFHLRFWISLTLKVTNSVNFVRSTSMNLINIASCARYARQRYFLKQTFLIVPFPGWFSDAPLWPLFSLRQNKLPTLPRLFLLPSSREMSAERRRSWRRRRYLDLLCLLFFHFLIFICYPNTRYSPKKWNTERVAANPGLCLP